jgi:membrane-associated protein
MDIIVQYILPYVLIYKYLALFIITFLAATFIPIPAGTLLIASAAFASQGYFNISTLLIVVIIANILGDSTSYWLSRLYGKQFLSRIIFLKKILESKNFNLIEKGINNKFSFVILISRFEVLSTITLNIISGIGKINYKKFLTYEVIGTFANVIFYSSLGYFFGDNWQSVNKLIGNFTIVLFLIIILCVSFFWKQLMHKLSKSI